MDVRIQYADTVPSSHPRANYKGCQTTYIRMYICMHTPSFCATRPHLLTSWTPADFPEAALPSAVVGYVRCSGTWSLSWRRSWSDWSLEEQLGRPAWVWCAARVNETVEKWHEKWKVRMRQWRSDMRSGGVIWGSGEVTWEVEGSYEAKWGGGRINTGRAKENISTHVCGYIFTYVRRWEVGMHANIVATVNCYIRSSEGGACCESRDMLHIGGLTTTHTYSMYA